MKTELIAFHKLVTVQGVEKYIVTTVTGVEVWVRKQDFNEASETISYIPHKAGDTVIANRDSKRMGADGKTPLYLKGASIKLEKANNEFKGCSIQRVEKFSSIQIMDHLMAKGVTPQFATT